MTYKSYMIETGWM